jgi:hypothetical protein
MDASGAGLSTMHGFIGGRPAADHLTINGLILV